jgi:hypothetical protein
MLENSWEAERLAASKEGLSSMELDMKQRDHKMWGSQEGNHEYYCPLGSGAVYHCIGGKCCLNINGRKEIYYNTGRYIKDSHNGSYNLQSSFRYITHFFSTVAYSSALGMQTTRSSAALVPIYYGVTPQNTVILEDKCINRGNGYSQA